jgi:signal transduction histidine kinase
VLHFKIQITRAKVLLIDQVKDNSLISYLEKTQKPLVRDEIQMLEKDFEGLAENMKHIEASLCLPMIISGKLIGIIVLGSKISGDAYTKEDLELLATLSKQAAIALDNARLYKQVQDFNMTLQQKVDEQTKDIKQAYEVEKRANEELKKTDEAKTQFMLITQHHLRTPLTAIKGYSDLLIAGSYGKIPKKAVEIITKIEESTNGEIKVVNDLLNVSQFQLGRGEVLVQDKISLEEIIKQIISGLKLEVDKKSIYLKFERFGIIPEIFADRSQLEIALTNVIDNAVKYTSQGGVLVNLEQVKDKLLISVKDTGIGISKDAIANLFKKAFYRGDVAQKLFVVGKGIGLYLSAKIIEAHKGKIWVESEGQEKGSTFYIELPLR